MLKVTLKEFVNGECPYLGCEYNNRGFCENESDQLLLDVMRKILDEGQINDTSFYCKHGSIKPSACEYCGKHLKPTLESRGEYFGIPAREEVWHCPDCD